MTVTRPEPSPPVPDADSRFYWEGLAGERLLIQACARCGRRRFPPMPSCPYCAATGSVIGEAEAGTVYSWITVRRAFQAAFEAEVPYTIATVDLDSGGRVVGRLEPGDAASPGLRVRSRFVHHEGWTELRFHPE